MEKIIRYQYKKPLSYSEIKKACNGRINVVTYDSLKGKTIDYLFNKYNCCIILYQTRPDFGHWVALIRHPDSIEHFDSYGFSIDQELSVTNPMGFKPMLSQMILDSGVKKIICNRKRLQRMGPSINTCGRWAIIRCLMKDVPLARFTSLFHNQSLDPDFYVTALTMFV